MSTITEIGVDESAAEGMHIKGSERIKFLLSDGKIFGPSPELGATNLAGFLGLGTGLGDVDVFFPPVSKHISGTAIFTSAIEVTAVPLSALSVIGFVCSDTCTNISSFLGNCTVRIFVVVST